MRFFVVKYRQILLKKYFQLSPRSGSECGQHSPRSEESKQAIQNSDPSSPLNESNEVLGAQQLMETSKPSKKQKRIQKKMRSNRTESGSSEEDIKSTHEMNKNCEAVGNDMGDTVSSKGHHVEEVHHQQAAKRQEVLPDVRCEPTQEKGADCENQGVNYSVAASIEDVETLPERPDLDSTVLRDEAVDHEHTQNSVTLGAETEECVNSSDSEAVSRDAIPDYSHLQSLSRQALLKESMNISKKLREIAKIESTAGTRKLDKLQIAKVQRKVSLQHQLEAVQHALSEIDNSAHATEAVSKEAEAMQEENALDGVQYEHDNSASAVLLPPGSFSEQLHPGISPPPGLPPPGLTPPTAGEILMNMPMPEKVTEDIPVDMKVLLSSISSELNRVAENFTGATGDNLEEELQEPQSQPCRTPTPAVAHLPPAQNFPNMVNPDPRFYAAMWANSTAMYDSIASQMWAAQIRQQHMWLNQAAANDPRKSLFMVE
jgi:hypothetical protein